MIVRANEHVELEAGTESFLTVWLESPGRSVNLLDAPMLEGLEAVVRRLADVSAELPVVFRSRKPRCFFAGADVQAIATIRDRDEVNNILLRGQRLMESIETLPMPTISAIGGMCMGGGLELALACRYRLASDSPTSKLGLPEIRLGLIPGWGGTQRLPRRVGLRRALPMILKGSALPARRALEIGLVDRVVSEAEWDEGIRGFVERLASLPPVDRSVAGWLRGQVARHFLRHLALRSTASQRSRYPALAKAIEAATLAFDRRRDGFAFERQAFAELLFTPTARHLLHLFVSRDRARKGTTWLPEFDTLEVPSLHKVAVVGAGTMGAGIGALAATKGLDVVFKEVDAATQQAGEVRVADLIEETCSRSGVSHDERKRLEERLQFTTAWSQLADCDLAIEAILEVDALKREVFQSLDLTLPPEALLTTNTSSLNVTQLSVATRRQGRVAGLHFFNPVQRMELLEIVRTELTDETTIATLLHLAKRLGKTPIVTSDKPGFLVNRVLFPYLAEAVRMVSEGFRIEAIDRSLRSFGMPVGPLTLIDQVGVDVAAHVADSLGGIQPDNRLSASLMAGMARRRWLGKKTGRGFYIWGKRVRPNRALQTAKRVPGNAGLVAEDGLDATQRRLVFPLLNEAVHCLDEAVVGEPWVVDLAMVIGTGFAPHTGGPLHLIDSIGVTKVWRQMEQLSERFGPRFEPAHGLVHRGQRGERFFVGSEGSPCAATREVHHES